MSKSLQLGITNPCHENWGRMSANAEGRFCGSCQKTVVDFTAMSDKELVKYFSSYSGNACGRFRNEQLSRELVQPGNKPVWYRHLINLLVPALLFSTKSFSQGGVLRKDSVVCKTSVQAGNIGPKEKRNVTIRLGGISAMSKETIFPIVGKIFDEEGEPISFATIVVKDRNEGAVADEKGQFLLKSKIKNPVLLISSVGYESKEISASHKEIQEVTLITLTMVVMGGIGSVSTIDTPSVFHQFKNFFTQLLSSDKVVSSIYPNPARPGSKLFLTHKNFSGRELKVDIMDMSGKILQSSFWGSKQSSLKQEITLNPSIGPGSYVVSFYNGKKRTSQTMIVQ